MAQDKKVGQFVVLLKEKRVAAGFSQRDVSDKLGYSTPQFISNWERGVSLPPLGKLKRLEDLYGVKLYEPLKEHYVTKAAENLDLKYYGKKKKAS